MIPENAATNPERGKGKLSRNPVLNPKSEPVEPTPVPFEMLETEPVQIEFTEPAEVEPALRNPEFEELIGSGWYKKRYDEMLKDEEKSERRRHTGNHQTKGSVLLCLSTSGHCRDGDGFIKQISMRVRYSRNWRDRRGEESLLKP